MFYAPRLVVRDVTTETQAGGGAGSALHPAILLSAGIATLVATVAASLGIWLQLKNYRKPLLQRMTVRIMIMVPLYAISSLISLFSLNAAFAIDAIRDIYEAFVIYNFFSLIVAYLGGERSVLILLYGRPPRKHVFPVSLFVRELDASDPFTFLFLKRGILQYVQVKPILTAATLILKATGTYKEGELSWSAGYLYVSFVYNISICLSLYCLAMFWACVNTDIKPFRPMGKFLCVKGILFFSFWQAITISALVAAGAIKHVGPYTDSEHISLALTDSLICYEMPFFAFAHWYAFSHTDYIDKHLQYAARMPFYYAFRDAFGLLDVLEDSRATLAGGVDYRTFEPVEGGMHQGIGRERRIKAGLRYAKGGRKKYWLPMPVDSRGTEGGRTTGPVARLKAAVEERTHLAQGYAPMVQEQAEDVFTDETAGAEAYRQREAGGFILHEDDPVDELEYHDPDSDDWTLQLSFDDAEKDQETERLFADSRRLLFGDYNYPAIDVSSEEAKRIMWAEEEQILTDQRAAAFSPVHWSAGASSTSALLNGIAKGGVRPPYRSSPNSLAGAGGPKGYGAVSATSQQLPTEPSVSSPSTATSPHNSHLSPINLRAHAQSDPDPRAARRAIEWQRQREKGKNSQSNLRGVYGGWAEQSSSSQSHSPTHSTASTPSTAQNHFDLPPSVAVIDYTPSVNDDKDGGMDLRYTRSSQQNRPPAPRASSSTNGKLVLDVGSARGASRRRAPSPLGPTPSQSRSRGGSLNSSAGAPSPTIRHVRPQVHHHDSSASASPSASTAALKSPSTEGQDEEEEDKLPSDAIDLVVEDHEAEEDEMTRERRKGEPAVRSTGERKIYRREYVVRVPSSSSVPGSPSVPASPTITKKGQGKKVGEKEIDVQVEIDEEPGVPRRADQLHSGGDSESQRQRREHQGQPVLNSEKVTLRDGESGEPVGGWTLDHGVHLSDDAADGKGKGLEVADEVHEEEVVREVAPPEGAMALMGEESESEVERAEEDVMSPQRLMSPPPFQSLGARNTLGDDNPWA